MKILENILSQKVIYQPHCNCEVAIGHHVKIQLEERVKTTDKKKKDFFFLTSLLDRNIRDEEVQNLRKNCPELKTMLLDVIKNNKIEVDSLLNAEENLTEKFKPKNFLEEHKEIFFQLESNNFFKTIYNNVPKRFKISNILVLFNVMKIIFQNLNIYISDIISNDDNLLLYKNLLSIDGISEKLATWSITNVTGHLFVIDTNISKALKSNNLKDKLPPKLKNKKEVTMKYAQAVWRKFFGRFNNEEWETYPKSEFVKDFQEYGFSEEDYIYLPFIITQTMWFYGRKQHCAVNNKKSK